MNYHSTYSNRTNGKYSMATLAAAKHRESKNLKVTEGYKVVDATSNFYRGMQGQKPKNTPRPGPEGMIKKGKMYVPDAYLNGDPLFSTSVTANQGTDRDVAANAWADSRGSFTSGNFPIDYGAMPAMQKVLASPMTYNTSHSPDGGSNALTLLTPDSCDTTAGCNGTFCPLDSTVASIPPGFPTTTQIVGPRSTAKSIYGEYQWDDTVKDGYVRHPFRYKTEPKDHLYGSNLGEVDAFGNTIFLHSMRYPYTNRDVRELRVQNTKIQPYPSIVRWEKYPVSDSSL